MRHQISELNGGILEFRQKISFDSALQNAKTLATGSKGFPRKKITLGVREMFNEDGEKICGRYTVMYEGYLFVGDSEGLNMHDYDRWEDVQSLIWAYGDIITIRDNEYGVTWEKGEWY